MWYTSSFSSSENLDCPVDLRFAAISLVFCIASLSNFTILYTVTTQSHYEFVKNLLTIFCGWTFVAFQGSFREGTRGNAVPVVEKLSKREAFPLLKCSRTPKCTRLQDFVYTISNVFSGVIFPDSLKRPWCLDPDTNFCLARQRSYSSCFTKRPLLSVLSFKATDVQLLQSYRNVRKIVFL